LASSL